MAFIGNTVTTQGFTPAIDYFNGDGSTTAFILSRPVASVAQVQVVVNNVPQLPGTAYTVSSSTITFTGAPSAGTSNIYVYYTSPITQVIAPSQGTVSSTSFASSTGSGAVVLATSPTIASPIITGSTPQITVYTSGSGTYTTPTNARYLQVKMVGGGGGGSGGGASGGTGGAGGNTTFGTSLLTCNGGSGGIDNNTNGGAGGSASVGSASGIALTGGSGDAGATSLSNVNYNHGGIGGSSAFGGAGSGAGGTNLGAGGAAVTNTGGGGGGGQGTNPNAYPGSGGGAGGYVDAYIISPASSYSYAVGAGGTAGTAGTNGAAGGAGGSGVIYVTAFF